MSQNQNDDQPLDTTAAENGPADDTAADVAASDVTATDATATDTTTSDVTMSDVTDATQVLGTSGSDHQHTEDDPLSVFDQGAATSVYGTSSGDTASYSAASYGTASYGTAAYGTASYGTPSADAGATQTGYVPQYAVPPTASYGAPPATGWAAPPKPLVRTTPRTSTIVWGFISLAIGVGAISVAAGATLDIGLAMIWLLAAAGAVLIVASVVGAVRRRNRAVGTARS
jgi:hypothetical protein